MLPAKNRLTKKEDFQRVIRKGRLFSFAGGTLKVVANNLEVARVGFLAGKKVSKKATERNAAKRKVRGIFLENIKKIKPGLDLLVMLGSGATDPEKKSIEAVLKKNDLLA